MNEGYDDYSGSEWLVTIILAGAIAGFVAMLFGGGYIVGVALNII